MTDETVMGGCLCGRIRYEMPAIPISAAICHCRSCRRAAGAESVAWATVAKADLHIDREQTWFASSPGVRRGFCPTCGTGLTYDDGAGTIDVALASLDDPEAVRPSKEIWLDHRISWNPASPDLDQRARGGGAD